MVMEHCIPRWNDNYIIIQATGNSVEKDMYTQGFFYEDRDCSFLLLLVFQSLTENIVGNHCNDNKTYVSSFQ